MINNNFPQEYLDSMKKELESVTEELASLPDNNLYYQNVDKQKKFMKSLTPEEHPGTFKSKNIPKKCLTKEPDLVNQLLRKEYLTAKRSLLEHDIRLFTALLPELKPLDFNSVYSSLPLRCRNIPKEKFISSMGLRFVRPKPSRDEEIPIRRLELSLKGMSAEEWGGMPYRENTSFLENKTRRGRNGLLFRSKSEISICDIYEANRIPYHYDEVFDGGIQYISPDFVSVNLNGEFIYHEHLGKIGDDEYLEYNLRKIRIYADAGITIGKNLIITADDIDGRIDLKSIEDIILYYWSGSFSQGQANN